MRKPGPRIGEHEETTKARVFQLIPEDPPGIRFTDIVRAARKLGYTKPTVWRYLDRFEDLELIIHEGRFYRRNPLSGGNARFHIKTGMGLHEFGFDELREVRLENLWDSRDKKRLWKFGDRTIAEDPKVLYDSLLITLQLALTGYVNLLETVKEAPSFAAAGEAAKIMMTSEVSYFLMQLARDVWDHREEVSFDVLDGKELSFTVSRSQVSEVFSVDESQPKAMLTHQNPKIVAGKASEKRKDLK